MSATANLESEFGADRPINKMVARQASEWLMRLHPAGQPSARDIAACERWRAQNIEHEIAWQRAQQLNEKFGIMPAAIGKATLNRPALVDRRRAIKTLAMALAIAPAAWMTYRHTPVSAWRAQYRTAVGEQRTILLADGSQIILNTDSAMDVQFTNEQRLLLLHRGEVLIQTGKDLHITKRPFLVKTEEGTLRALGTRFIVRKHAGYSTLSVFEHAVELRNGQTPIHTQIVSAGEQPRFSPTQIDIIGPVNPHAAAWSLGMIQANNTRLDDFATEVARYRRGWIRCDPAIADMKISGSFQVEDTDHILQALVATLPIKVTFHTRYWVNIEPA